MKTLLLMTFMVIPFLPYKKIGKLKSSCTQQEKPVDQDGSYNTSWRVYKNSDNTADLKKKQNINQLYCSAILRKMNFTTA